MSAIADAVDFIHKEVKACLGNTVDVKMDSARKLLKEDSSGACITLINIQEEATLRNLPHAERRNNQTLYSEPPVHLNLYLLFAFNFLQYSTSLSHLGKTIELFQRKRWFSAQTQSGPGAVPFPPSLEKLVMEMVNMNLEELNNLWGVMGDAYFPSVVYKVRMVRIQGGDSSPAPEILDIQLNQVIE